MAFGFIGSRFAFLRLNLGPKAVLSAALLIAVNTALVVGAGYWSLTRDFDTRAQRDIDVNLRTLSLAFGETFPNAKILVRDGVVDRIEIPQMPEFSDHKIVDKATAYVGGTATLFVYDDASQQFVRRTTNLKKENGDRAVGTQLAADHPAQTVLRRGEAYKGPAMLFGRRFYTAYQPVFDTAGKVIGIVYVGIPTAQFDSMLWQALGAMVIAAAIAALLVLGMTMVIVRRVTKPLKAVTEALTVLAEGRTDVEVQHADRYDEIGAIARTVDVFKNNRLERRQLEAERLSAEKLAMDRRKAELNKFVEDFRAKIGGIIERVLNSSGQFEKMHSSFKADQIHCGTDQSPRAQRHYRGRARRRRRPWICGGRARGQDPGGPDCKSHRRDQCTHCEHAARHGRFRKCDQGDRADDRAHQRDHHIDFLRCRAAGHCDPKHRERRPGCRQRHP